MLEVSIVAFIINKIIMRAIKIDDISEIYVLHCNVVVPILLLSYL